MKPKKFKLELPEVLPQPGIPENLSDGVKWLSGEGAGSWFDLYFENGMLFMQRYTAKGIKECENTFPVPDDFNPSQDFEITYPCFCNKITVIQGDKKIIFKK